MKYLKPIDGLVLVLLAVLAYGAGGGGCTLVTAAPPFKAPLPAVLLTHDSSAAARAALSAGQLDVLLSQADGSVRDRITKSGGQVRLLDKSQSDLSMEAEWVRNAWAVKSPEVPAIVAASPTAGVAPQKLGADTSTEAVLKLLSPLGVK